MQHCWALSRASACLYLPNKIAVSAFRIKNVQGNMQRSKKNKSFRKIFFGAFKWNENCTWCINICITFFLLHPNALNYVLIQWLRSSQWWCDKQTLHCDSDLAFRWPDDFVDFKFHEILPKNKFLRNFHEKLLHKHWVKLYHEI